MRDRPPISTGPNGPTTPARMRDPSLLLSQAELRTSDSQAACELARARAEQATKSVGGPDSTAAQLLAARVALTTALVDSNWLRPLLGQASAGFREAEPACGSELQLRALCGERLALCERARHEAKRGDFKTASHQIGKAEEVNALIPKERSSNGEPDLFSLVIGLEKRLIEIGIYSKPPTLEVEASASDALLVREVRQIHSFGSDLRTELALELLKLVPEYAKLPLVSYEGLRELSFFAAQVLKESSQEHPQDALEAQRIHCAISALHGRYQKAAGELSEVRNSVTQSDRELRNDLSGAIARYLALAPDDHSREIARLTNLIGHGAWQTESVGGRRIPTEMTVAIVHEIAEIKLLSGAPKGALKELRTVVSGISPAASKAKSENRDETAQDSSRLVTARHYSLCAAAHLDCGSYELALKAAYQSRDQLRSLSHAPAHHALSAAQTALRLHTARWCVEGREGQIPELIKWLEKCQRGQMDKHLLAEVLHEGYLLGARAARMERGLDRSAEYLDRAEAIQRWHPPVTNSVAHASFRLEKGLTLLAEYKLAEMLRGSAASAQSVGGDQLLEAFRTALKFPQTGAVVAAAACNVIEHFYTVPGRQQLELRKGLLTSKAKIREALGNRVSLSTLFRRYGLPKISEVG